MNKLFLTMTLAFCTMIASAQYSVLTTVTSVEDEAGESTDSKRNVFIKYVYLTSPYLTFRILVTLSNF